MQSPSPANIADVNPQSDNETENEELFRKPLFRVIKNLQHDERVHEEKWGKTFVVALEYIAHVVAVCPSLFIPNKAAPGDNTEGKVEVTIEQGYGLTCLIINHLLQLLTHSADPAITTKARNLVPAILNLLRTTDPVHFRRLLSELIFCLGDLTHIHESFFQDVDKGYKAELNRFQIPAPKDNAGELQSTSEGINLKKRSVTLTDPASCECLQANICEVLLKMVMDVSRLSLDSGCRSETKPPDLLWACLGCHIESGEIEVKKASLRLLTSLLTHCDLPGGQVREYLVDLLVKLVNMLCAGFNEAEGDYDGLEEALGTCLITLVTKTKDVLVWPQQRLEVQTGLFMGLMAALTDHGLHRLRTPHLQNMVCTALGQLVATFPEHVMLHNELVADCRGELARTLVEEVEEVGQNTTGIVLCLRELILLELPPTFPGQTADLPETDPKPTDDMGKIPRRKRKLSTSTAAVVETSKVDVQNLSRTLHHVVSKITKLCTRINQEDFKVETCEGALCGIWLLLETVVQCIAARPYPVTTASTTPSVYRASPVKSQYRTATPHDNLTPWLGSSCLSDLCTVWMRVIQLLCHVTTPEVGAGDATPSGGHRKELVSGAYRAIVRSIGALVSVNDIGTMSPEIYTKLTALLSLHWMPNEMSWQDLKPTNHQDMARVADSLADAISDDVLAETVTVLTRLPKDSAAKWRIHVLRTAAGSPTVEVCAAAAAGFPFLLHHCGPNANHLVYDVLHEVLKKDEPLIMTEVADVIGPLACVVSRKAVLQRNLPQDCTKLSFQDISIQCVSCDNLSDKCEGSRDRPKIVDPNMFQPFLFLLKTSDPNIKMRVIGNLRRLFGHISVRSNNTATVNMMEACLQLIEDPKHKVRMAFSNVVGYFVGTDQSDKASETDRRLITALKTAASKAERDGHIAVVETVLITMGQLGRKVSSDLFFVIIVCLLDGFCNPFSPLTSSVAKTQLTQLAAYKGIEMKELFVQYGRNISKIVADHCLDIVKRDKCDPLELVQELTDLFGFDSSKAFLRHTERYMLPHLVLKATPHASFLIRTIAKALGDPNHKNPLARNIDSIFSELAISAQGNELLQAFAFLEAESEWDLPTLLRLGQHVDSELLLHLSTHYKEVLIGIKIYLTKLMFTRKSHLTDEEAADMLQPKLLGILVHFDNHLLMGTIPLREKKQVFESVILLMKLMGPKHITSVRVRLMTTLKIGMKLGMKDEGFQELCCRAWNSFVHSIDITALGPMLAQIIVSLQPLLKIFPKQVALIFHYLIVENRGALQHHFHELYFVPEIPELADVNAVLQKYVHGPKSNAGLEQQISQLLKGISHESQDVRVLALTKLRSLLRTNHEKLHQFIGATETADPIISDVITALLAGCRTRESDQGIRVLYGECLGELGAVDPGRLELMSSASKDELAKFQWSVTEDLFAVDLINTLAKAFLRAEDRGKQDCVAFSIQELIRAYEITPKGGTSSRGGLLWKRFAEDVQEIMEPLTRSKYSLNFVQDWSVLHKPIYRGRKGSNFNMWVTTLTGYLISKVTQVKAKQVFDTCRAVVKNDPHLALYLLPHVTVQVLLDGTKDDHKEVKTEMMAVLKHAEERETRQANTSELRHMCAQTVFSLLDHFTKWTRHRLMVLSMQAEGASRAKSSASNVDKVSEDAAYQAVGGFLNQIQQDVLASASYNCGAYTRSLMHIEQFIKPNPERLDEHLDFLQKLYVELHEPDGMAGITAIKHTEPTISEQVMAYRSIGQLSDASVCYDQMIQQEPGDLSCRQKLLECRLALGELQSAMDLANGMITDRPMWAGNLNAYRVEAAWKLGQWDRLGQFLKAEGKSMGWMVGLGKVLYAVKTRNETEFVENLRQMRDDLMSPLSAASMEVGSYHRGYESIVRLHMLNELEQGVKCLVGFPRETLGNIADSGTSSSHQAVPLTVEQLKAQWESRLQFTQSAFRTQEPILTLRRTLLSLGRKERNLSLDKNIGQCWLQTAKVARESGLLQTAHSSIVSAGTYDLPGMSIERAKWLWDRGDYDMAQSCLEKALEQHYPRRSEVKLDDTSWGRDDRFQCAQMLLLLGQYSEETASMESNALVKHYREVHKIHSDWEDGYFFIAKYYDKIMTKLIPSDRPERKGDFIVQMLNNFGQSLEHGNQYIYESMPRMLSLWLDYGSEVAESETKPKNEVTLQGMRAVLAHLNKMMANYTNRLAPYQFLTAFPQLTSRICHAHSDVFSQLRDLIAKLLDVFPQQTMWMMMAVSKSSYQIRMKRCQEIFNSAKLLNSSLNKFLLDSTKLTDRLLDLCNKPPVNNSDTTMSIKQHFKPLLRLLNDQKFSPILLPLQSLMTVTLPSVTAGTTKHDPFPMKQVYIKDIEDTVELLQSLQRPKKITMRGSDGRLYIMLCKPKDDLRKDARLMEFNTIINKFLRKNFESRRRDLHIRTYTVTPLNEECGLLEWVSNTSGFRNVLNKLYRERGLYTTGKELRSMALPGNAPLQKKIDMYKQKLLPRHPAVFSDWFLKTFPDPTSWYNARLAYARTTAVMSMVGYILGLGDRHGENILFDSTNGDVLHVDFNCLFNKGETFDVPEIVPFRLTHNMVEAMGPTGYEGVYRRACETTLRVMRNQSDPLMSVLKTFIYDPLVEWSKPVKGRSSESGEIKNEKAYIHVSNIEQRLKGVLKNKTKPRGLPLSVEGHVNHLIKEATDEINLCQMYIGWAAYM